jgi:hypothetical protein
MGRKNYTCQDPRDGCREVVVQVLEPEPAPPLLVPVTVIRDPAPPQTIAVQVLVAEPAPQNILVPVTVILKDDKGGSAAPPTKKAGRPRKDQGGGAGKGRGKGK